MTAFNIDNHEVVELTNKLEKLHKSAMPVAVRQTLNDLAFEAKKDVKDIFKKQFTERKKNFISAHTKAVKSKNTFNINDMASEMGVIKGKSDAGDELKVLEKGGTISGNASIPTSEVRVSKSASKLVSKRYYLNKLKGKGVISRTKKRRLYASDKGIIENIAGQKGFKVLYRFTNTRKYEAEPFLKPAGLKASKKTIQFYKKNAEKRFKWAGKIR